MQCIFRFRISSPEEKSDNSNLIFQYKGEFHNVLAVSQFFQNVAKLSMYFYQQRNIIATNTANNLPSSYSCSDHLESICKHIFGVKIFPVRYNFHQRNISKSIQNSLNRLKNSCWRCVIFFQVSRFSPFFFFFLGEEPFLSLDVKLL